MLTKKEDSKGTGKTCRKSKEQLCKDLKTSILRNDLNKISEYGIIQLALAELVDDPEIKYELLKRAQT